MSLHAIDEYCHCRRCGLLLTSSVLSKSCTPPDPDTLVKRRLATLVLTNPHETQVQRAMQSLFKTLNPDPPRYTAEQLKRIYDDDNDAARPDTED